MGIKQDLSKVWSGVLNKISPSSSSNVLGVGRVHTGHKPMMPTWMYNPMLGIPRDASPSLLRKYSNSIWVRMCIRAIINEILGMDWDVVVKEGYELTPEVEDKIDEIKNFFNTRAFTPTTKGDYNSFIRALLNDLFTLDAGVIVKVFEDKSTGEKTYEYELNKSFVKQNEDFLASRGISSDYPVYPVSTDPVVDDARMVEMMVADGGSFLVQTDRHGRLLEGKPTWFQYSFLHPAGAPIPFFKREVSYWKMHPKTYTYYGRSPIQDIMNTLSLLMNSTRHNQKFFEEYAVPSGIVNVPGMSKTELKSFIESWKKLKGRPWKLAFVSEENFGFKQLTVSNKEMQWLDSQKFYMKLVMAAFGVTQGALGFTDELNKHSSDRQDIVFLRQGVLPKVKFIEDKFNADIIPEFFDGDEVPVRFKYLVEDVFASKEEEAKWSQWVRDGRRTINEWRSERGLDPVSWGDEPYKSTGFGFNSFVNSSLPAESKSVASRVEKKYPGKVTNYSSFLKDYYEGLEEEVLKSIEDNKVGASVIKSVRTNKSFGDFVSSIINIFGVEGLKEKLRAVVKSSFVSGVSRAEEETGVQIGYLEKHNPLIDKLTEQEVNGYVLNDGKRWSGLKGVNEELRKEVHQAVVSGLNAGEGMNDIKDRVKSVFGDAKDWEAMRIARTESNRLANTGQLKGYIDSGVPGKKVWLATIDARTSDVCKRLNGQKAGLTDVFVDEVTGEEFEKPPAHPNCFDETTELLTDKGWKLFKDVNKKDMVLSVNLGTGDSEWVKIKQLIELELNDELVHYKNKVCDLMVTKDHSQVVYFRVKNKGRKDAGEWLLIPENDLPNHDFSFLGTIPDYQGVESKKIRIGEHEFKTEDFVEFLGYYLAEGNIIKRERGSVHYIQITQNKDRYYDKMLKCAKKLFNKIYECSDRFYIVLKNEENKKLIKWFKRLGHAKNKYIPREIKELSKKYLRILLDAHLLGDGNVKKGKFWKGYQFSDCKNHFTISDRLASDIGELILKLGHRPSYRKQGDKVCEFDNGKYFCHSCWHISELIRPNPTREYLVKDYVKYDGKVYDVELERNHTLFVRRNGKVLCSGNCRSTIYFKVDETG